MVATMSSKPTILLDCDGCVADYVGLLLETVKDVTGRVREHSDITSFDVMHSLDLPVAEQKAVKAEMLQPGWCSAIRVLPGAHDFVNALQELGSVVWVTAPGDSDMCSETWPHERSLWLAVNFGADRKRDIIYTGRKFQVAGDFLIDDSAVHIREWQAHRAGAAILLDRPWNRGVGYINRVVGYAAVLAQIRSLIKEGAA